MADALSRHAEEAYGELTTEREPPDRRSMFKALTETTAEAAGTAAAMPRAASCARSPARRSAKS